jgi:hypothetical protein
MMQTTLQEGEQKVKSFEEKFVISSEEFGSLKRAQGLLHCWVEEGACSPLLHASSPA